MPIRQISLLSIASAALLAVGACSSTTTPPDTSMPPPIDCGASALANKAGGVVTGSTAQDVRIDGQPVRSTGTVRIYQSGQPVTQDYNPNRLNLEVSVARTLVRASCG
ncbi:I78 family peptidase inhibitor [Pelagibacterium lacus]|nr:I78 family peptidase inhibitor [Pelagibacterium lacus]